MRLRWKSRIVALAATLLGSLLVNAPSAAAATPMSNPSAEHEFGCSGAKVKIQIDWKAANKVSVYWRLEDTADAGTRHPVLRIAAQGPDGTTPYVFGHRPRRL